MLALVGRELCLFLHADATRVPTRQRTAFLALAVRRAAPFPDPEFDVLWLGDHAAVWYWSRSRVRERVPELSDRTTYRAEALFRGELQQGDATELLLASEAGGGSPRGIEARVWRAGRLVANRWWADLPDDASWRAFTRGAGLDASLARPSATEAPLREHALQSRAGGPALGRNLADMREMGRWAIVVAACSLALGLVWQLAGMARAAWELRAVDRRIERVSGHLEPIIKARERADTAQGTIRQWLALRPAASQVRMLAEVRRVTPGDWQMRMWHQPTPETLEVTLHAAKPDVAAIVAAWEKSPLFADVSTVPSGGRDELRLQARLVAPWQEPSP